MLVLSMDERGEWIYGGGGEGNLMRVLPQLSKPSTKLPLHPNLPLQTDVTVSDRDPNLAGGSMQRDGEDQLRLLKLDDVGNDAFEVALPITAANISAGWEARGNAPNAGVATDCVLLDTEDGEEREIRRVAMPHSG